MHWLTEDCMFLQSDATYLVVTDDGQIEKYGLNAVCTHLGCVVPWNNVSTLTALESCVILQQISIPDQWQLLTTLQELCNLATLLYI